ncbi:glutamate--tRNA ligase [Alphaproteobacteria bacterium]|nr:glutamate--tRNA ligase [Alphaproteobacteria bacterium]
MTAKVRTRFAPSPTGWLHIGGLRTALYAWLIARRGGGAFILRIEDTDLARQVDGAVDIIEKTLKTVGLAWDEGPGVGGAYGPYVQTQRRDIYQKYAKELVENGGAHYCFCSAETVDKARAEAAAHGMASFKYYDPCKEIPAAEASARAASGEPFTVRQNIPLGRMLEFHDEIYGAISVDSSSLDEGILLKSDGLPTYNLANVIDDHLMEISHVVRGNEYLSQTAKYNLIYDALGWTPPKYVHVSQIMKDARTKLSKRNGDASFQDLIAKGYLPAAILNYIALLGWNPGTTQEVFSLAELAETFDIKGMHKSPALFDPEKLSWLNGQYIRRMTPGEFHAYALPFYGQAVEAGAGVNLAELSRTLQPRIETFAAVRELTAFVQTLPDYGAGLFESAKMKVDAAMARKALEALRGFFAGYKGDWTREALSDELPALAAREGLKNGQLLWPLRAALSGAEFSCGGGVELAAVLGPNLTAERVEIGLAKLASCEKA